MDSQDVIVVPDDEEETPFQDSGNEYINEDDVYVVEDDSYINDVNKDGQSDLFQPKDIQKQEITTNIHQSEKEVDEVIVNSHLKEIVDIKNQIKELQDILYDKPQTSGERHRLEEVDEDENVECQVKTSSANIPLKRSYPLRSNVTKKTVRNIEGTTSFKRPASKDFLSDRFKTRTLPLFTESKRRLKRNEMMETESGDGLESGLSQSPVSKKMSHDSAKIRVERKTKLGIEDTTSEEVADIKLQEIENVPTSVINSLRKILQTTAHTPEEKYKVLDARDKLYKMIRERDPTSKTRALVGTCPDMCSEKERLQREFQFQIPIFEMINSPKNTNLSHNRAVKQYSRSSADQEEPLPHELRPVNVLTMTMGYLLHNVADHCELSDENLGEWYMYMWDRTRALRKELTQQGLCSLETVDLVEQCARFHIHCAERLADQDISIYDDKINTENLTKCLQTLRYMYRDLANEDIYCPNESEFVCYSLLLNLNNTSVFAEFDDMARRIMSSEPVQFALDVMSAWEMRNYVRFFNLVKRATYLNSCILRRYFVEMRLYAIRTMIRSYCTKYYSPQIPIYRFVDNLGFESIEECCQFLSRCNFDLVNKDGVPCVNFNRLAFQYPETQFPTDRAHVTIGAKKKLPFSMIMAGGELPPKTYEDHVPQNSFTASGELKLDSLICKELMEFANSSSAPTVLSPQLPKNKSFEPKGEFCRISKESEAPFTDIFEKPQKLDANAEDSQGPENIYVEEKSAPSAFGGKETNSFGSSTASIFRMPSYNAFHTEGSKPDTLFALKQSNVFPDGSSENKPKFEAGTTTNIFGFGSGFFQNSNLKQPSSQFQNQTDFSNFTFKTPVFSSQPKAEDKTAKNEIGKMESENEKHKSESKKQNEEEEYEEEEEEEEEEDEEDEEDEDHEEEQEVKMRIALIEAVNKARQEAEQREKQRKEAEEERKQREIKEREEKMRVEELKMQENIQKANLLKLEELARLEEEKRKTDAAFKLRVDEKTASLKKKYWKWKVAVFFKKWRLRTWEIVEERKMKDYFREVRLRYPAVCTEEDLNGNPYGLVIPNVLMLRKYQSTQEEYKKKKTPCEQVVIEKLPLLDVKKIVAEPLELRAKRLFNKVDPFPWKVIFSVPDESECRSWKAMETFIEMSFVDQQNSLFARDHGALSYHEGCHSTFRYKISVRRARGSHLYEGSEINREVMNGCNALVFVMSEDAVMNFAKERLTEVIYSRSPLPQIPLIIFLLGEQLDTSDIENYFELGRWLKTHISEYCFVKTSGCTKEELISKFTKALNLAAEKSAPVTHLRIAEFADFCSKEWFECIWRRIETCFSNYKIVLTDPNILLECYNESVDELLKLFTDKEYKNYTLIGEEFLEKRLERPKINDLYKKKLTVALESLKLASWPGEKAKDCDQFRDQIHQYCMKIVCEEKKIKELKWQLYRIIRTSLLWKGLDIYCSEEIENILENFPWIQFFQEISLFLVQQLTQKNACEEELTVLYSLDEMNKLVYESGLISKYLDKCTDDRWRLLEGEEPKPCIENDSVIYAYSLALERENNKRKRENSEDSVENLFEEPEIKRLLLEDEPSPRIDLSDLKKSFQKLEEKLDELEKRLKENAKFFREMGFE